MANNDSSISCSDNIRLESPRLSAAEAEDSFVLKIVSAFYGPCEGRQRQEGGNILRDNDEASASRIPFTRDVTPILRALLQRQEQKQQQHSVVSTGRDNDGNVSENDNLSPDAAKVSNTDDKVLNQEQEQEDFLEEDPHLVRLKSISGGTGGMKRTAIPIQALHDGCNSMNVVFGDACPGTSKKLHIHYVIRYTGPARYHLMQKPMAPSTAVTSSEVHHVSFSEYEPVILRRNVAFYQEDEALQQATARLLAKKTNATSCPAEVGSILASTVLGSAAGKEDTVDEGSPVSKLRRSSSLNVIDGATEDGDEDEETLQVARQMGRTDSILDFVELSASQSFPGERGAQSATENDNRTKTISMSASPVRPARLRSATFEIVLPVALPFLQIQERVHCRLVSRLWRNIVRDWGVAAVIDSNDPNFQQAFTRPFLRGILSNSYSSLHSLRLTDFKEVCPEDLHPSLPHLRKLRVLDISRCTQLHDETLKLLAQHVSSTLEVLYIKGLVRVSDDGLIAVCEACTKLKVLELSHIPITDKSGIAIGTHLINLRALYMRDNFRLTNQSIDIITANCTKLSQLTLWGCIKLKHLYFDGSNGETLTTTSAPRGVVEYPNHQGIDPHKVSSGKLVSLSLWGCLKLGDDIASALGNMKNLRSLVVSECHRLTDQFAIGISQHVPQLVFLHLRYCKRITDAGVIAVANGLENLYSLDLSFCSRVTSRSICALLDARRETLSELRLQECRQLRIANDPSDFDDYGNGLRGARQNIALDGQVILKSLRSPGGRLRSTNLQQESILSLLDLRCCGGQPIIEVGYSDKDAFVRGMKALQFEQKAPGFFARPARWNERVQARLLEQLDKNNQIC